MNQRIYILLPAFLLLLSLFMPALSVSGRNEFGYSLLVFGWFQSYIAITAIENWYAHGMIDSESLRSSLFMAFPWFANISIVLSVGFLAVSKFKLALIFSIFALLCVIVFFINPVAMLGADGITVAVTPLIGAYLWALSALACFTLVFLHSRRAKENT